MFSGCLPACMHAVLACLRCVALQWQESSRAVMTKEYADKGWFLEFKDQSSCDNAAPCSTAAWHNILNGSAPLIPCDKTAPIIAPNCPYCCNFTKTYV